MACYCTALRCCSVGVALRCCVAPCGSPLLGCAAQLLRGLSWLHRPCVAPRRGSLRRCVAPLLCDSSMLRCCTCPALHRVLVRALLRVQLRALLRAWLLCGSLLGLAAPLLRDAHAHLSNLARDEKAAHSGSELATRTRGLFEKRARVCGVGRPAAAISMCQSVRYSDSPRGTHRASEGRTKANALNSRNVDMPRSTKTSHPAVKAITARFP